MYKRTKGKGRGKLFFTHTDRAVGYAMQCLGSKDLGEYTTIDAGAFRDWLFTKGLKRSSVSRNLTIVKAVVNLCIQEEGLGINNPFAKVYIPSDENHTKRHSLTIEQIKLLQQRCRQQDDSLRWLAALISDTGMRLAEAVGLSKDDLKLTDEVPHVVIRKHSWRPLKTSGSERIMPLVGAALWASQSLSDNVSGQFLFPQYVDGISTNANSASAALNKWMKTFLPKEIVVHGMRHGFGASLWAAQRIKQNGSEYCFPRYTDGIKCNSNSASAALNKWIKQVAGSGNVIHGFRHSFRDRLRAVSAPIDMIDQLGG